MELGRTSENSAYFGVGYSVFCFDLRGNNFSDDPRSQTTTGPTVHPQSCWGLSNSPALSSTARTILIEAVTICITSSLAELKIYVPCLAISFIIVIIEL
jgi:hypothetical protein